MQLFILLFIEGGSYIQEDEDKWEFVVLSVRTQPIRPVEELDHVTDTSVVLKRTTRASPTTLPDTPHSIPFGAGLTRFA